MLDPFPAKHMIDLDRFTTWIWLLPLFLFAWAQAGVRLVVGG